MSGIPTFDDLGQRMRFRLWHDINAEEQSASIVARLRIEAEVCYVVFPAESILEPRGHVVRLLRAMEGTARAAHDASCEDWEWLQGPVPEQWVPRRRKRLQDGRHRGWVLPEGPEGWPLP